jgi:hypothetical protein
MRVRGRRPLTPMSRKPSAASMRRPARPDSATAPGLQAGGLCACERVGSEGFCLPDQSAWLTHAAPSAVDGFLHASLREGSRRCLAKIGIWRRLRHLFIKRSASLRSSARLLINASSALLRPNLPEINLAYSRRDPQTKATPNLNPKSFTGAVRYVVRSRIAE